MIRPFILGLTGSIGMGKSTVAGMFEALGVAVFDADQVVRRLQGPAGDLLASIEQAFPGSTGTVGVDRAKLGAQVFGNGEALKRLEAIVHPAVRAARAAFMRKHEGARLVVLDIPLLLENGGEHQVDAVVVVSASPEAQGERVLARSGMTAERLAMILAQQMPDGEKRARADHLIDTGGTLEEIQRQVAELVDKLAG
ncbi:MAG: dephospho-CoA kinase [Croceibacterium sp.]